MSYTILVVAATSSEADILQNISGLLPVIDGYRYANIKVKPLITGIGSISTSWAMKQWISVNGKPDFALNIGIAGSYNSALSIGEVVIPMSDVFADAGIEDGEDFLTLSEAGLISPGEFPYNKGLLIADTRHGVKLKSHLKSVKAITVNTATGSKTTRQKLAEKFNPDIETMEGATFFYICAMEDIPFMALRAISNRVEVRNKNKWNIPLALENLTKTISEIILTMEVKK
jgi:futalosine hydrolase